jgi:hypothetical protein
MFWLLDSKTGGGLHALSSKLVKKSGGHRTLAATTFRGAALLSQPP